MGLLRNPHDIIIKPLLTEKSTGLKDRENKLAFKVHKDANRVEVKRAIEEIFKIKVRDVNIMNLKGKKKRMGKFLGKRPDWKKAIVSLKPGEKLDILEEA